MEERLIELETRFSFQEDAVETLSNLVADQQAQIDVLTRHVDRITTLLQKLIHDDKPED
jgi:uncharacterized coiled-coil protein SlyX